MSGSNPSAASAATMEQQPADIQQLIGLLDSLMPLLLRFQSQAAFQSPADFAAFVSPQPALDQQAAVNLANDMTASTLRNLSAYLETNASGHPELTNCFPIVTQAARCFAMRDYGQALNLIWQAYRAIAQVRANDPQLPPLQVGDNAAASASAPPTSVH